MVIKFKFHYSVIWLKTVLRMLVLPLLSLVDCFQFAPVTVWQLQNLFILSLALDLASLRLYHCKNYCFWQLHPCSPRLFATDLPVTVGLPGGWEVLSFVSIFFAFSYYLELWEAWEVISALPKKIDSVWGNVNSRMESQNGKWLKAKERIELKALSKRSGSYSRT